MPIFGAKTRDLGPTVFYEGNDNFRVGDDVIVETEHGNSLATIVSGPIVVLPASSGQVFPIVLREANEKELAIGRENAAMSRDALNFCKKCIADHSLDMKLIDVEIFFDRSKYIFYFTAPSRIDFRDLVKDLVRQYRARIELRQIGVRHETQLLGALGNCGMVCCCKIYLKKFAPVTIKMAKEQNLFLNPAKISGICGRLLCCLAYEQDNYDDFHARSPKPGKKYMTRQGAFRVLRVNMFTSSVHLLSDSGEEREVSLDQWEALAPRRGPDSGHEPAHEDVKADRTQKKFPSHHGKIAQSAQGYTEK